MKENKSGALLRGFLMKCRVEVFLDERGKQYFDEIDGKFCMRWGMGVFGSDVMFRGGRSEKY